MKKIILFFLFTNILLAQTPNAVMQDRMNFEPGELIVKLKDEVNTKVYYAKSGKASSDFNIGELLGISDKVKSSTMMFHQKSIEASIVNKEKMKAVYAAKSAANPNNGYQPKDPLTMKNVFVLKTSDQQENILQLIQQIKDDPNVEYAEPNYIYSIDNFEVGDVITAEEASKISKSNSSSTIEVNDPLYSSQSNITSTNIDDVWDQYTTGDGSQVIAILDTGVDYTHPDLEANIWINEAELNGVAGYDDDGNGYIDDIRGWDFINNDNAPLDDNMHGTHVAGIAGAVGNNGIGIAGAAWNVKLIPIKVFQSSGQGNLVTIADGVEYAYMNGATIINMSFGGYSESYTFKLALENAYSTTSLVGAAGNNGLGIGPDCLGCKPFYPAAYSYIIATMDYSGYSNYDQDGVRRTMYQNLLNYEIHSPGTNIISTIPNGGYASLTGTSMGAPLLSGAIALYKEVLPENSNELMMGSLIHTAPNWFDIHSAINTIPTPELDIVNHYSRDEIDNQNGNGFWETGETIEILPNVKNFWGPTDDVRVGIEFAEFEDQSKATILTSEVQYGSMSAYSYLQDLENTLKITIADGVNNNVDITFVVKVWSGPDQEYMSEEYEVVLTVTNAIIFEDYITEDLTLTNDREWIFANSMVISNGATLTIDPGTTVKMSENSRIIVDEYSSIFSNGTAEQPVTIESAENGYWRGVLIEGSAPIYSNSQSSSVEELKLDPLLSRAKFTFTNFKNWGLAGSEFGGAVQWYGNYFQGPAVYEDCNFQEFNYGWAFLGSGGIFDRCNLRYGTFVTKMIKNNSFSSSMVWNNSNWSNLDLSGEHKLDDVTVGYSGLIMINDQYNSENYQAPLYNFRIGFNLFNLRAMTINWSQMTLEPEVNINMGATTQGSGIYDFPSQVWVGSNNEDLMRLKFWDYTTSEVYNGLINYDTRPSTPFEGAHGIVWKVLVNGYDAQDEYALLDPVGVGTHEFKVYFNRAMDTSVNPRISYGVSIPYTQKIISETGTWSTDGKIYTVNHDVIIGAADGINRIRVQDAQDLDFIKIPIEDMRFNMLVQSAGSASAGWFATPGLGNIALEWEAPSAEEIDDALGYNMYRYQVDADGVESDLVKLNESLIVEDTDESTTGVYYTDFDVTEGQTYFYKYNILRTSFDTTDFSSVVSTSPLTSTLGDSNGDFDVDVMDLVHDVDYILGNNPTPFIFLAGDVNADTFINVLDIVGTVDIILNPSSSSNSSVGSNGIQFYPSEAIGNANFTWEGNDLYVESDHNIGGIQLSFNTDFEYVLSEDLPTIEHIDYTQEDSKILMLYSFNNTTIASSKTKILTRIDDSQEFDIEQAVVGTTTGAKLNATLNNGTLSTIDAPFQNKNLQFLNLFPNPTQGLVNLEYYLPKQMDGATAKVYDMVGRLVWVQSIERSEGIQQANLNLNTLKKGNYIVIIIAGNNRGEQFVTNKILILK